jgi:hypothetical protein
MVAAPIVGVALAGLLLGPTSGRERWPAAAPGPAEGRAQQAELLPRRPIGDLHGLESRSSLRWAAAPEVARTFLAVYVFPDRARWEFELADGGRRRVYRLGPSVHYDQGDRSRVMVEPERSRLVGELELRRALLLWPAGFEWRSAGSGPDAGAAREADLGLAGRLRAVLDAKSGNPNEIALLAPDGTTRESYRALRWTGVERARPTAAELWHGDTLLWTETFERATPAVYIDGYFLPLDRQSATGPDSEIEGVRRLQAFTVLRVALADGTSWEAALAEERLARSRWAEKLGAERLAGRPTFELAADGRPAAALLRIEPPLEPAPEGWQQQGEREGFASFVQRAELERLDAARLRELRSRLPEGARPAPPYARVDAASGVVQIVLPFAR